MTETAAAPSYLATAFQSQYNLILLGGSALFSLASASPLPLLVGLAGEALWLGLGSRLSAFRRRVDERVEAERRGVADDAAVAAVRGLSAEHGQRVVAVGQAISVISLQAAGHDAVPGSRTALSELEQLRPVFVSFCQLHERLGSRLQELALSPPQQEVQLLSQAYAAEKDLAARFTLHQQIKLAQKKVEQQSRLAEMRRAVESKLALVEQGVAHLQQQVQSGVVTAELARDMSGLVAQVGTPASLEAELSAMARRDP